ncbi:ribosome biogenesis protein BOP1 homolog [Parasteatoda tepidariorum]|uniref:ribosome biogenesis protein BOP1 homolog n=1 Tax=Parasteatoda tepidariorum TaxID=114398 RepID=UPI0039BD2399
MSELFRFAVLNHWQKELIRNPRPYPPGFLAENTSSSSSDTDGYEMLAVESEIVSEESNLTFDEDDANDSDDMEELSAEIEHSESSTTDDEDGEILDSDDMEELSAEIEHSESSTTDDEDVEILDRDDLVELRAELEPKESSSSDDDDIAILNSKKMEELQADIEPKESEMILDKGIVAMTGSDRSGHFYFEIDSREKKILAKANKVKESLDIVVGLKRCGDISLLTKNLEEKLAQNPDFAEKRELARKREKKSFRNLVRCLVSGCFKRK